jgi:hypothetical protein
MIGRREFITLIGGQAMPVIGGTLEMPGKREVAIQCEAFCET